MNQKITISNNGDKDLNVFLCDYMNRSYLERYAIRKITKKHSSPLGFVIYGCEQEKVQFTGSGNWLGVMCDDSVIVKDIVVSANNLLQLKTTMALLRLDGGLVEYLSFYGFWDTDHTPNNTISIRAINIELTRQVMLAFEMKARCSLTITFILNN